MNALFDTLRELVQAGAASGWLPASLAYGFVVNAVIAGLMIGPVLGGLGTLVVVKRFAFFSEAVGHAALTGVAIGILLGEPYTGPYGSLFGYCLLFGIGLNYLRNRTGLAPDTLIGVFLSVSLALGASLLLILAGRINVHILENVLFGSVLTVNNQDLQVLLIVALLVAALALPFYNRLMLASFNPQLAAVRGVAVKALDYLFVGLVTIVTVAAVKVIGAILVGALLVIPAATARLLSHSLKGFFRFSVGVATLATLSGILLPIQFVSAGAFRRGDHPVGWHRFSTGRSGAQPAAGFEGGIRMTLLKKMAGAAALLTAALWSLPTLATTVLAGHPVTYALASDLATGSTLKIVRAAPENIPPTRLSAYLTGRGEAAFADAAREADAVITLRSLWPEDPLYPLARRSQIRIVEIDAAQPIDGALPGIALQAGKALPSQPWLDPVNLGRMADILANELGRGWSQPHSRRSRRDWPPSSAG